MKLLIDIPEHIYEHAKESSEDSRDEFDAMRAIANGTQQESSSENPNKSEIPTSCGDAISRQMVLEGLRTCYDTETKEYSDGSQWINYEDAVAEMENLPSVKPQPCEDCISRAYIGPIIEELENICVNGDEHVLDLLADVKNAPPVTPQFCEDAISRREALNAITMAEVRWQAVDNVNKLPSVTPQQRTGRCKDCKYFEYDSVAKVDGIPLIVAHEICSKWGGGCKTKEDGYCFLFEPQESEVES